MRLRLAALLVITCLDATAQRGGGMAMGRAGGGGRWGGQMPMPPRFGGMGRNPWWGGRPGFSPFVPGWGFSTWFDTPLCASPLFPLAPNCSYGDAGGAAYYPPPPPNPSPANVTVVFPPSPPPAPPPIRITSASMDEASNSSSIHLANGYPINLGEISQAGAVDPPQAQPVRNSPVQQHFLPLIVLKTGAYSVHRYWMKGQTLYFETMSGDTLSAPVYLLERILPAR